MVATRHPSAHLVCPDLLKALLVGGPPPVPGILDSDGLRLCKPDGGIRPIAIGETGLRLGNLCACDECRVLGPGITESGAMHCIRMVLGTQPDQHPVPELQDHVGLGTTLTQPCAYAPGFISRSTQSHLSSFRTSSWAGGVLGFWWFPF
jgi:hypothetical protein